MSGVIITPPHFYGGCVKMTQRVCLKQLGARWVFPSSASVYISAAQALFSKAFNRQLHDYTHRQVTCAGSPGSFTGRVPVRVQPSASMSGLSAWPESGFYD